MIRFPGHQSPLLLELDLTEPPVETPAEDPLARLQARGRRQLRPTLRALHEAGKDHRVAGLIAKISGLPWALMQELRLGAEAFKAGGKPAVAWAENFGEGPGEMAGYVLASTFDEIWLQPTGGVGLLGVGIETTFLRGTLDKLGIEPHFEQRYEYKNAADVFMRTDFTPAHREALEKLAESIFADAVTAISTAREMSVDQVRMIIDTGPRTADEALEAGLVDHLGYRDQVYDAVRARIGQEVRLLFADRWRPPRRPSLPGRQRNHVALVEVNGVIASGRSQYGPLGRRSGSDSVAAALRAAAQDERAKAVVLKVDSPGGSAVASDTIWREVGRLREAEKPVVVSMGEVAGSGGYYVACPADVIVALPATLTGSIGVLGGKFALGELLERVGLHTGSVKFGARSLMYSSRRGFSDEERERLGAANDAVYDDFVGKVAAGRGRSVEDIEAVARGRIWTGRDAVDAGLVDELGGLRVAVRIARERANLPEKAPALPALHVPPLARLGHAKNSEDPRAQVLAWPRLSEVATLLGLPPEATLQMPPIFLR